MSAFPPELRTEKRGFRLSARDAAAEIHFTFEFLLIHETFFHLHLLDFYTGGDTCRSGVFLGFTLFTVSILG